MDLNFARIVLFHWPRVLVLLFLRIITVYVRVHMLTPDLLLKLPVESCSIGTFLSLLNLHSLRLFSLVLERQRTLLLSCLVVMKPPLVLPSAGLWILVLALIFLP